MSRDCVRCFRPTRPIRTRLEDHPGTVSYGAKGMCQTCYRIDANYEPPADRQVQAVEQNRATLRAYLRSRGRTVTI